MDENWWLSWYYSSIISIHINKIDDDNLICFCFVFKVIIDIWYDILDFPDGTSTIWVQKTKVGWCTKDRPKMDFLEDQTTRDGQICSDFPKFGTIKVSRI